jgi:hypothetical protein
MSLWSKDSANPIPKYLSKSDLATYRAQDCYIGAAGYYYVPEKFNKIGAGTITTSTSSTAVTGTGSKFLSEAKVGQWLVSTPDNSATGSWDAKSIVGKIVAIASDTGLTLDKNAPATGTGKYSIIQKVQPELLVALNPSSTSQIPDRLGATEIVSLEWKDKKTLVAGATSTIIVHFSEPVKVTGAPTLGLSGAVTATYSSMDATGTKAAFTFTAPVAGTSVTISNQNLGGTGNIVDLLGASPATTAVTSVAISAAVAGKLRSIVSA